MSLNSMTGFGRAATTIDGAPHTVEIKAVNHRYLDVKIRLPRALAPLEVEVGRRVRATLGRGRIEVTISGGGGEAGVANDVAVDLGLARRLLAAVEELGAELDLPGKPDVAFVAQWPGVLQPVVRDVDPADLAPALGAAVDAALGALQAMRAHEGAALAAEIEGMLAAIEADRLVLVGAAPEQDRAYQQRLRGRLDEFLADSGVALDAGRLLHEVALFADRTDVSEELARLQMHLDQARSLLAADTPVGRRLDFLCQEMFREANTLGSKVQSADLTSKVVELKSRLEQLREQVQNVE
ncbi:MAG: YicC/YloC family endoribonuclease [bacterium]